MRICYMITLILLASLVASQEEMVQGSSGPVTYYEEPDEEQKTEEPEFYYPETTEIKSSVSTQEDTKESEPFVSTTGDPTMVPVQEPITTGIDPPAEETKKSEQVEVLSSAIQEVEPVQPITEDTDSYKIMAFENSIKATKKDMLRLDSEIADLHESVRLLQKITYVLGGFILLLAGYVYLKKRKIEL
jgi:hypothetical protein